MTLRTMRFALLALAGPALSASCREARPAGNGAPAVAEAGLPPEVLRNRIRGVLLGAPQPRPDFTLTTVDGARFDFRTETAGQFTLLFFGYTHCPDICPIHVANVSKVLKDLPLDVSRNVQFVFVTTDPERDTPERLRGWLAQFHPGFIGLTGSEEEIRAAQLAASLMPAIRQIPDSTNPGAYLVGHAAQVLAYTSDDLAHVVYPFGVRQQDWANDLPILVRGWPR
jgi:protein SCO1/2